MDFTIKVYNELITTLLHSGYLLMPFREYLTAPGKNTVILRHDVDMLPGNSLNFARMQYRLGIRGTYYFRTVPESFDAEIIKEIYSMGHEIGYHYEDFATVSGKVEGLKHKGVIRGIKGPKSHEPSGVNDSDVEELAALAIESFRENLARMRAIVPVTTICMHGSPLSRWDSRLLWKYYDYRNFGIAGEPYFDIDQAEVFYLTDTGRCWDGDKFNIRDKAYALSGNNSHHNPLRFHSTHSIIKASQQGLLPDRIMMTFHPQRWTGDTIPWIRELIFQNVKNIAKYMLIRIRG